MHPDKIETNNKPKCDYEISNNWGCSVVWSNTSQFKKWNKETIFDVSGHQAVIPKIGQTLKGDFAKATIVFEFISVSTCRNPTDMFFAKVKATQRIEKQTQ